MNDLVIVGRYPFADRKLEGMVQRIANIDAQVADRPRTYLDLYVLKHLRASLQHIGNADVYTASFLHFWSVLRILRHARDIYVHSVYFYALILLPLIFIGKRARLILDIHGTVPEEIQHTGNKLLARVMGWVERRAFSRISLAVCVTRRMHSFYRSKYPETKAELVYLPIFTAQVCTPADLAQIGELRAKLGIPSTAVVYLYSGGLQPWQNVDRMLSATRKLLSNDDNWFIFLTGETEALSEKFKSAFGQIPERVRITHARPEDLRNYYELANFGFILREDHILNRVANPTKLVEYLYFGIRPIVWSADIGDFVGMGYEYVSVDSLDAARIEPSKSTTNRRISLQLLRDAHSANISRHLGSAPP